MRTEDSEWLALEAVIVGMINGEMDPGGGVLPPGVSTPLEEFARHLAEAWSVDIALTLPMAHVMVSGAVQGSRVLHAPLHRGQVLKTPQVSQAVTLADSGIGKSTLLDAAEPHVEAANLAGLMARQSYVAARAGSAPMGTNAPLWDEMCQAGTCPATLLDSATQEAIRNGLAENGAHQMIWTAEPDVFEDASRYSKDAGSVTMFINTYDQANIRIRRVKEGYMEAREASMPMQVFVQNETFGEVTGARQYVSKGVLHRMMITSGGWVAGDGEEDWAVPAADHGAALEAAMVVLAEQAAPYRSSKAMIAHWTRHGLGAQGVPRPQAVGRTVVSLTPSGLEEYRRLQHLRSVARDAVEMLRAEQPGQASLLQPLALRLTSLVLRLAMNAAASLDPHRPDVPGPLVRDMALRVLPWLWHHWHTVMLARTRAVVEDAIAQDMRGNQRFSDVTEAGAVLRSMAVLSDGLGMRAGEPGPLMSRSQILKRAQNALPHARKEAHGIYAALGTALDALVSEADHVEVVVGTYPGGAKEKYRLTVHGVARALTGH